MSETTVSYAGLRAAPAERLAKSASLLRWIAEHVDELSTDIRLEQFNGGQSNPTFCLSSGHTRYVLRSKPTGELLPSAHAIEREYRVMRALGTTEVPVPRTFALCTDTEVFGSPFYVMEHVEGRIFWDPSLPGMTRCERRDIYEELNRVVAAIHGVVPADVGLHDYGQPQDYLARQVRRWTRQYRASETHCVAAMDRLIEWLPTRIPTQHRDGLVHGDYRIDNVVFHPHLPRIVAVLDWELSTLGDPLADFSYHCLGWLLPPVRGLNGVPLESLGLPSQDDYFASYLRRTGVPASSIGPEQWRYYLAFNLFRLASILQGVAARALKGNASSAHANLAASRVTPLAERALALVE